MEADIFAGGENAIARLKARRASSDKLLADLFGEQQARMIAQDKSLLPFLLPVLHSKGQNKDAVDRLRLEVSLESQAKYFPVMLSLTPPSRKVGGTPSGEPIFALKADLEGDSRVTRTVQVCIPA